MTTSNLRRRSKATLLSTLLAFLPTAASAQETTDIDSLLDLPFEDVMKIKVTIASRTPEEVSALPAAVSVITQEDIRRSGVTHPAEALRLVPGMNVARIDANRWAISARGFNSLFANKLLVLVDGRTVYTPLFSGVYWDVQDLVLEDIERIEVIRGPGGSVWGANAVNGVVNIVTKNARDAQGTMAVAALGTEDSFTSLRHGAKVGESTYVKTYVKATNRDGTKREEGGENYDEWDMVRGGVRVDSALSTRDDLMIDLSAYSGDEGLESKVPIVTPPFSERRQKETDFYGGHVLGRWRRSYSDTSESSLQVFYDTASRDDLVYQTIDTFDIDFNHRFQLASSHQIVWGADWRNVSDETARAVNVSFDPASRTTNRVGGFVQDEITLSPDLRFTLGSKLEHNDFTGWEIQPTARAIYKLGDKQSVWSAVSRSVRIPSRASDDVRFDLAAFPSPQGVPVLAQLRGDRSTRAEELLAYEIGYRYQPTQDLLFDVATYWYDFEGLVTFEPGSPVPGGLTPIPYGILPLRTANNNDARAFGGELNADWTWRKGARLQLGYSYINTKAYPEPTTADPNAPFIEDPQHQLFLRSLISLADGLEFDSMLRYSDNNWLFVKAYMELDLRLGYKLNQNVELSLVGQNLLHDEHKEYRSDFADVTQAEIQRAVYGKVVVRF